MNTLKIKAMKMLSKLAKEEKGGSEIVAVIVLVAVVMLLAVVFKDQIANVVNNLFNSINQSATNVVAPM